MIEFPTITLTKTFKITKLVFTEVTIPDHQYVIGNTAFAISIADFKILPSDFDMTDFDPSYAAYW